MYPGASGLIIWNRCAGQRRIEEQKMRALVCNVYGPVEDMTIEDWKDPLPAPGEVLIDIRAAGVNFPDLLIVAGQYQVKLPPPFIAGNEAAGIVSAVGEGVTRFSPGDRVMATTLTGGMFAEKGVAPAGLVMPIVGGLDFDAAAGLSIAYGTTYHALRQCADLKPGETVLVLGAAGGVGIAAVELAKAMGANVIAAASTDEKLSFAREAGADQTLNYSELPLKETVRELTNGSGADVVYDPVGGELAQQAFRATAWHGRYLVIGFASGEIPKFPANIALLKEASVTGVYWGNWREKNPEQEAQNFADMGRMIENGQLTPRITASFPLDQFVDAFRLIRDRTVLGKVVITM
jgi:NADPH2:quinone reductase